MKLWDSFLNDSLFLYNELFNKNVEFAKMETLDHVHFNLTLGSVYLGDSKDPTKTFLLNYEKYIKSTVQENIFYFNKKSTKDIERINSILSTYDLSINGFNDFPSKEFSDN